MNWAVADDIADRIRRIRLMLGDGADAPLPQAELARRAGVRASQVSQWERGAQKPSRSRLERWADREGWPVTIFSAGGPPPETALRPPAPSDADAQLARFYQLMAEAAERGAPFPAELVRVVDALYRGARAGGSDIPRW